ncbi:Cas10/Cmr2 second palm domain-containing protein [Streptomyces sp. NPDC092359]|uniref:Cas10/Cmr2 second palm domain-containing protein n=1 Tax=Streptomyces sp. NPDC092359 TaxID=3366014 RepID=UPI0038168AFF
MSEPHTGSTRVYVDFGAIRIQSYLSRTAGLRGHRTASDALARATARRVIEDVVGHLAEVNDEAGEADGVVSIRFVPTPGMDVETHVRRLQDEVFAHLRRELPGAEFQSVWGEGEYYLNAYARQIQPRTEVGEVRHDLPATAEFPLAVPCGMCHTDPAATRGKIVGKEVWLCPDCSMRNVPRGMSKNDESSPEGRLRNSLPVNHDAPEGFETLAALGRAESGRNHLATVSVDGNAFGEFFKALVKEGGEDPRMRTWKQKISKDLSQATRQALTEATLGLALTDELDRMVVVPHVVGGDDVLVSLPADQAWAFTLAFLHQFGAAVHEATSGILEVLNGRRAERGEGVPALQAPTASAGIVFAHAGHPLTLLAEYADQCLREAKRAVRGKAASVQWRDITAEGTEQARRDPLLLSMLRTPDGEPTGTAKALSALASVPSSHRSRLAEAVRADGEITAAVIAQRVGHLKAVRPFLSPFDRRNAPPPAGIALGAALTLTRWWPCA